MLRSKVKKVLSLVISASMVVGTLGYAQPVNAAETDSPLWEVDTEEEEDSLEESIESEEVEEETPEYAEDENVRVFIVFEEEAVVDAGYSPEEVATSSAAEKYSEKLEDAQNEVIETIEKEALEGESLDTRYSFTLLTNAVSADVAYGQIEDIEAVDGVEAVYICPVYEVQKSQDTSDPETMTSGEMVGSYQTWTSGYTGAGMRIAVIDTGLDTDHPSFDEGAFLYSLQEQADKNEKSISDYDLLDTEEIDSVLSTLNANTMYDGLTASDLYLNSKVAYAFNYVDENLDVTHDNDSEGDHGTHVSGISTANKYVPTSEEGVYETQENGVVGIAPDAQLMVMKVFGSNGGAYTDDYMAAIEDALVLGADTINLSLGSSNAGESSSADEYVNTVMDKLYGTDTVVSISAGNAYYWSKYSQYGYNLSTDVDVDTVGSPGSYTNAFTVASAINSGYTANAVTVGDYYAFYLDGSSANNAAFTTLDTTGNGTEYEYVLIDGYGTEDDFAKVDVTGKIAICSRGSISFYVKHMNAEAAGAAGVLIYNNTTGTISMNLTGSTATIPAASIKLADAEAIKELSAYDEETGAYTGTLTVSNKVVTDHNASDGYLMSEFSSWGVPGDLSLKPEITAPGGNIYSTLTDGQYGLMSGTSMAAPSVAGISALVLQYIEENDLAAKTGLSARTLAQSLLMGTATPLAEADGTLYSPRKQGAGLANAELATTAPTYILVGDEENNDGKVKAELGDDPERTGEYSFDFTVYNMTDRVVYYDLDATLLTESVISDGEDNYVANNSYELGTETDFYSDSVEYLYDLNSDSRINKLDAMVLLQYINKTSDSEKASICEDDFDFDDNGVLDTNDVTLFMQAMSRWYDGDIDLSKLVLAVYDEATVTVDIDLSDEDKAYIDENFENGMYVEGFVQLDGQIDQSIPLLAFYGSWTESSMFEPYNLLTNNEVATYSGVSRTNYLTYQFAGSSSKYYYTGNFYATDDEYIADRNAINSESGDSIASFVYTLIRNASDVKAEITNAETGDVYYSLDKGSASGSFYSSSASQWYYTSSSASLGWKGTDADGNALADGTKVNISVTAVPAYYNDETKTPADGASIVIPFTIDNTAPTATLDSFDEDAGTMTITLSDNQYVAAVLVCDSDKKTVLSRNAVNQTEAGADTQITIAYPTSVFYVKVIDYAGNLTRYRVNMSGEEDTTIASSIELNASELTLVKNSEETLEATVGPVTLLDDSVVWSSEDESIATVDENGIVTGVGEGTTTIKATTVSLGADGEPLVAECIVNVITIDVDLNATLWDTEGKVYFSKFNTSSLPDYSTLSEAQDSAFWSAAVADGKLYASTYNSDQDSSDFYCIDPDNNYEATYLTTSTWNTDMAYGVKSDKLCGTYAYYIVVSDLDGTVEGAYNLSSKTGGEYLTGITYIGSMYYSNYETYADVFVLTDRSGNLYQFRLLYGLGYICGKIGTTNISTNGMWYYESLYYDDETGFYFYSVYDKSDEVTLYAIDISSTIKVYPLGQFASGVWPVAGLYQWDSESADADSMTAGVDFESLELVSTELESIDNVSFETSAVKEFTGVEKDEEVLDEESMEETDSEEALNEEALDEAVLEEETLEEETVDAEEAITDTLTEESDEENAAEETSVEEVGEE